MTLYNDLLRHTPALFYGVLPSIFVSFLAYCLHVTLGQWLRTLTPGLTTRSVLEKFAAVQMVDVHIPTSVAVLMSFGRRIVWDIRLQSNVPVGIWICGYCREPSAILG